MAFKLWQWLHFYWYHWAECLCNFWKWEKISSATHKEFLTSLLKPPSFVTFDFHTLRSLKILHLYCENNNVLSTMPKSMYSYVTWFRGMSCPTMHLRQYIRAESVMARGALQLPQTSVPVPVKSKTALPCRKTHRWTETIIITTAM